MWVLVAMKPDRRQGKSLRAGKRTYNTRLIRRDYGYFISEIADLFDVHRNALRRWIKIGLRTVDDHRPVLVYGSDLIEFLDVRQTNRKQKCAADEFYCCRCRRPQHARFNHVEIQIRNETRLNLSAICDPCGTRMNRAGSVAKIEVYNRNFIIQTPAERRLSGCSDPIVMCHLDKDKIHAKLQSEE
jgi:transposase-like protein